MPKQRHTNRLASYLILIQDEQILLARRYQTGFQDGNYSLPAGHVDAGETFSDAIIREAHEEIGITVQHSDLKHLHTQHRKSERNIEYVDVYFTTTTWAGEITNLEPHKCDDLVWFPINDLPENTVEYVRQVITHIQNQCYYSEYGWE